MTDRLDHEPDFSADRIPVWFIDTEGTIAYHLYPDCGHLNERSERELSKSMVGFRSVGSLKEWQEQITSNRHMCKHCLSRFKREWMRSEL